MCITRIHVLLLVVYNTIIVADIFPTTRILYARAGD